MESLLITIDYHDPLMLAVAFLFGFGFYRIGLPPLVGFLAAGFALGAMGAENTPLLTELADLGVTLLLFTIGLKLRVSSLLKPEIWGVATLHMLVTVIVFSAILLGLGAIGLSLFAGLNLTTALIVAFALSFSSTVFAVKTLESAGESGSRFGRIAIGVLIVQDIAAVVFLAASSGKLPSPWAFTLLGLLLLRKPILALLNKSGHGELQILIGFVLALGGAQLFEVFTLKGDLGALFVGAMIAGHTSSDELAKTLLGFKELFLVAFFLSIGLSGLPTTEIFFVALLLMALVPLKAVLFFWLFTRFRLLATTANRTSLVLANYSEFGLIVAAIAVSIGWLPTEWMLVDAVVLSLSFVFASVINTNPNLLFNRYRGLLKRFESPKRLAEDAPIEFGAASIIIFGMGRVGTGVYDAMNKAFPGSVIGVDHDNLVTQEHRQLGKNVVTGNASNPEFWDRANMSEHVAYVLLVMPDHNAQVAAIKQIRERGFEGKIAATAKYPDDLEKLEELGVDAALNIYAEVGTGFALLASSEFGLISEQYENK
ncbi:MAG: cation:proton antiporter [Gammaproteobacteria bacterium]|nr:cation:proton antiporter [Gammaproteobacteria bacterium]NNL06946.1 cation:proton antiporter [Gammaproteobacteria bacterium]